MLGHVAFALALYSIVEKNKREVRVLHLNPWYLDDEMLCTLTSDFLRCLAMSKMPEPVRRLHLNRRHSL